MLLYCAEHESSVRHAACSARARCEGASGALALSIELHTEFDARSHCVGTPDRFLLLLTVVMPVVTPVVKGLLAPEPAMVFTAGDIHRFLNFLNMACSLTAVSIIEFVLASKYSKYCNRFLDTYTVSFGFPPERSMARIIQ